MHLLFRSRCLQGAFLCFVGHCGLDEIRARSSVQEMIYQIKRSSSAGSIRIQSIYLLPTIQYQASTDTIAAKSVTTQLLAPDSMLHLIDVLAHMPYLYVL
jgi:hypothetical protein